MSDDLIRNGLRESSIPTLDTGQLDARGGWGRQLIRLKWLTVFQKGAFGPLSRMADRWTEVQKNPVNKDIYASISLCL